MDFDPRIVESPGHEGQILLRDADDVLVQFANDDFLHSGMTRDFAQDAAVSSADDEDLFGVGVGEEGDVRDHFLVGEFVAFGALDDSVEDEDFAVVGGLEDEDVLEAGGLVVEEFLDLEGEGLAGPEGAAFVEPRVLDEVRVVLGGWEVGGHGEWWEIGGYCDRLADDG